MLERGAHFADAQFVALGQFGQALAQRFGEALLRLARFGAALARVLGERFTQRGHVGVGACDQLGELLPEHVDTGFLLLAKTIELGAQFSQPPGEQLAGAQLRLGAFFACLAGIFAERVAQQVQALVGAGGELGEIAREGLQAAILLPRQALELFA